MKKILGLLVLLLISFSLVGCTNQSNSGDDSVIKFTDHANREVTILETAERIVSGYYTTTTLCMALGLTDNLVAIEMKADTRELYKQAAPELLNLPGVSTKKDINVEETLAQEPDLVILPLSLKDSADTFTKVGVDVIVVNPESPKLVEETVDFIGKATGREDAAQKFNDYNKNTLAEVEALTKNIAEADRPTALVHDNDLEIAASSYYQNEMITIAGGKSVVTTPGSSWTTVNIEEIINWNPEYIFHTYGNRGDYSNLTGVSAVANNNIYEIPSKIENWDTPGASSTLGILYMFNVFHADLYSKTTLKADVINFYQTFFGFIPEDSLLGLE